MTKKTRPPTKDEKVFWETMRLEFATYGITDMDKAQDLWFHAWDHGWMSRKSSYASVREAVGVVCEMAKREGILYKFQDDIPEMPKPGGDPQPGQITTAIDQRRKLWRKGKSQK